MKVIPQILVIMASITLTFAYPANGQKGTGSLTGMGQETVKPSIEKFIGELVEIKTGPCENTTGHAYIGTHLYVKNSTDGQVLNVHLGAAYAVESYVNRLVTGQEIEVHGFRTEKMEPGNFIAKQITTNGNTLQLRDDNLRPFWAGDQLSQRNRQYDTRRRRRW